MSYRSTSENKTDKIHYSSGEIQYNPFKKLANIENTNIAINKKLKINHCKKKADINILPANFTKKESDLLNKYFTFYKSLDSGKREPDTEAQIQFVKVCHGEKEPTTIHEIAYRKYQQKIIKKV